MKCHNFIGSTDQLAANEDSRNRGAKAKHRQSLLDLPASSDLVHLVHRRVNPKPTQQPHHSVAHAARALAEDHDRPLWNHPSNSLHSSTRFQLKFEPTGRAGYLYGPITPGKVNEYWTGEGKSRKEEYVISRCIYDMSRWEDIKWNDNVGIFAIVMRKIETCPS